MSNSVLCSSTEDLFEIAKQIIGSTKGVKTIAFRGNLGAGKTTLIGKICKYLGVTDYQGSPTFSIVNEYEIENNKGIFHFDCYRIKDEYEILDIGWEEYLASDKWVFIEWPEKVENLLPEHFLLVNIEVEEEIRRIEWKMF